MSSHVGFTQKPKGNDMSTKKKSIWNNLKPVANSANVIVYEVVAPTHAALRAQPPKARRRPPSIE